MSGDSEVIGLIKAFCDGAGIPCEVKTGPLPVPASDHRQALVRAVLGQQWAVAVTWAEVHSYYDNEATDVRGGLSRQSTSATKAKGAWGVGLMLADLPCADDVIADQLGEVRLLCGCPDDAQHAGSPCHRVQR